MIAFDLNCANGHRFEGWFASSAAFAEQADRGLVSCPQCGNAEVAKAPMAPAVPAKGNTRSDPASAKQPVSNALPPKVLQAMAALATAQAKALENSTWVGGAFAEESRRIHYGEREQAVIHGQATREEAQALAEEGIPVAPLPFPVAPPDEVN